MTAVLEIFYWSCSSLYAIKLITVFIILQRGSYPNNNHFTVNTNVSYNGYLEHFSLRENTFTNPQQESTLQSHYRGKWNNSSLDMTQGLQLSLRVLHCASVVMRNVADKEKVSSDSNGCLNGLSHTDFRVDVSSL